MLPPKSKKPSPRDKEQRRLNKLVLYEQEARSQGFLTIAGIDEAGRGPLAGPVHAAACIIPEGVFFRGIDDSKKLTAEERSSLYESITTHPDVSFSVDFIPNEEIDRLNIFQATMLAMLKTLAGLQKTPDYLLVDGLQLPHATIPCKKIIKGDSLSQSIAAASIIAKVTRDRVMVEYDKQWPQYGFGQHKGYATVQHIEAIKAHGPCPIHRMTYEPLSSLFCKPASEQLEFAGF